MAGLNAAAWVQPAAVVATLVLAYLLSKCALVLVPSCCVRLADCD